MGKITIGNVKNRMPQAINRVFRYGGRGSPIGNKFVLGRDGDRKTVIGRYRVDFYDRIEQGDKELLKELRWIYDTAQDREVVLLCHCVPKACHLEVVKEYLDGWLDKPYYKEVR